MTLSDLMAAIDAASGDSDVSAALGDLAVPTLPLTQTIRLGDLLTVQEGSEGGFRDIDLNVLELLTGSFQLFNQQHALGAPEPVTISGADLGLQGLINEVAIQAFVTEAPVFVCGTEGATFHSAAIRIALHIDLVDVAASDSTLLNLLSIGLSTKIVELNLYLDIARGSGVVQAID